MMAALRIGKDEQWLLLHNRALQGEASARVKSRESALHASLLDVSTRRRLRVNYARVGGGLEIDVRIHPYGLWALHLAATPPVASRMPEFQSSESVAAEWEISRAVDDSGKKFEPIGPRSALEDWRNWPDMNS
jgi:hypothetical protein